jgi:hypothetical protein
MKKVDNRQYKLTQIRPPVLFREKANIKRGRRQDSRLDRRGMR